MNLFGHLDLSAFEAAVNQLVIRHWALRTGFHLNSKALSPRQRLAKLREFVYSGICHRDLFEQCVIPSAHTAIRSVILDPRAGSLAPTDFDAIACGECIRPFNYHRPPLIRITVVSSGATEHCAIVVVHHLIADLWSIRLFREELQAAYSAVVERRQFPLPPPLLQYPTFSRWQREELVETPHFDESLAYWRGQHFALQSGQFELSDFPFSLSGDDTRRSGSAIEQMFIGPGLCQRLKDFLRVSNITLYVLLFTALSIVLHLCTSKRRIALLAHFANRSKPDLQAMFGWAVNSNVIGLEVSPYRCVRELLQEAGDLVLRSIAHDELPAPLTSTQTGHGFRHGNVAVVFDLTNQSDLGEKAVSFSRDLTLRDVTLLQVEREVDLYVYARETGRDLELAVQFATRKFDVSGIRELLCHWRSVLTGVVLNPNAPVRTFRK